MSDELALLAAIWDQPHEDLPRRAYADWLDENGRPERAEFIRLQCEQARLDEWDDAARIEGLKRREEELWAVHRKAWKESLPKGIQNASFRRGFVYPKRMGLGGEKFLKLKPGAFDAAPQWAATLEKFVRQFDRVFASPQLVRLNELAIKMGNLLQDPFAKLAGNDLLRNVSELSVSELTTAGQRDAPDSVAAFFNGPAAASLTKLESYAQLGEESFAALAASRTAPRLSHLHLHGWRISTAAGPPFSADKFPRLRSLRAFNSRIVQFLTATPDTQLRKLDLSSCILGDREIEQLAAWPGLARVRWLDVGYNTFRQPGYLALARSPHAGNLIYLRADEHHLREMPKVKAELVARFGSVVQCK